VGEEEGKGKRPIGRQSYAFNRGGASSCKYAELRGSGDFNAVGDYRLSVVARRAAAFLQLQPTVYYSILPARFKSDPFYRATQGDIGSFYPLVTN
jgi:hypothetical protein